MWAALRSDLREFVATVAEDTSTALTNIDAKLDADDDDEAEEEVEEEEGNISKETQDEGQDDRDPLLSPPPPPSTTTTTTTSRTLSPSTSSSNKTSQVFLDAEGNVIAGNFASTGIIASPADEAARLAGHEETYLEPLQVETDEEFAELKDFLATFNVEDKTEEISQLLSDHWDIQQHFERLVPTQVKYEDFWQRYYFRCNVDRIAQQWKTEQEKARQARTAAFTGGLLSVRSLLGGALSAVSQKLESSSTSKDDGDDHHHHPAAGGGSSSTSKSFTGLNLFGSSGRPPFVMNTAVDESFDDYAPTKTKKEEGEEGEEEEAEEEELGWDDEEEEEAGGGGEEDDDDEDQVEEIEFKDDAKEQLQKLLAQAISERDQLHETVELQRNEIATLKLAGVGSSDLDKLKMELFEKDSELAALKASLEDTHDDGGSTPASGKKDAAKAALQEREIERLSNELSEKECEVLDLKQQLRKIRGELEEQGLELQSTKTALVESRAVNEDLQSKIGTLEQALAAASSTSTAESSSTQQELQAAQALIAQLNLRVEELSSQLESSNKKAEQALTNAATLEKQPPVVVVPELSSTKSLLLPPHAQAEEDDAAAAIHASPDSSTSTTVKVVPPKTTGAAPAAVTAGAVRLKSGDEEDDWGDDWGDDDEN